MKKAGNSCDTIDADFTIRKFVHLSTIDGILLTKVLLSIHGNLYYFAHSGYTKKEEKCLPETERLRISICLGKMGAICAFGEGIKKGRSGKNGPFMSSAVSGAALREKTYMPSSRGRKSVMSGKSTMTTRASVEASSMGSTGGVISSMVRLLILAPT